MISNRSHSRSHAPQSQLVLTSPPRPPRFSIVFALVLAVAPVAWLTPLTEALAQDRQFWEQDASSAPRTTRPRRDDAFNAPPASGPAGGFGQQADMTGQPYGGPGYGGQPYGGAQPSYDTQPPANPRQIRPYDQGGYAGAPPSGPPYGSGQADPYARQAQGGQPYGGQPYGGQPYGGPPSGSQGNDAYQPPQPGYAGGGYGAGQQGGNDAYRPGGQAPAYQPGYADNGGGGYGQAYAPPPDTYASRDAGPPPAYGDDRRYDDRRGGGTYSQNEVVDAGHRFFGSVSQGLARAVESVFKRQGRPNGYILGEDAGGAFVAGLRYGEGVLSTKDAGTHKVYWQGPSLGYDFGGEGSKTMVLVYNMRDPSDIYHRFGGVQGSAYLIGGVSVQFQALDGITLAVIRSGIGLRLGANVGYLKYTRRPTWNPF